MDSKREELAQHDQASPNEVAWTYEIPFQYAWVAPELVEMTLDPECAAAFLESELSSICRVRIDLAAPNSKGSATRMRVWQLLASCPFCDAGKDQLLRSGNWVDVYEWPEDMEADLLNDGHPRSGSYIGIRVMYEEGGIERCLDWQFFSKAMRSWGLKACSGNGSSIADEGLVDPMGLPPNGSLKNAVNVYGVSLAETLATLDEESSTEHGTRKDASNGHAAETIAREFGIEGYFGGLYRCGHCGNTFAVVYRDPWDDTKEGRYRIMPEIAQAIDQLLAKRGHADAVSGEGATTLGHVPTMSAHVGQDKNRITLRANIAGLMHELVFDTAVGSFLLDDDPFVSDEPTPHLRIDALRSCPLIGDFISEMPGLVIDLLAMLPPLPEGVDLRPTRLQEFGCGINLLVAANRFVGYPAAFYDEMVLSASGSSSTCGLELAYPFGSGLPRDYAGVDVLFEKTGLPDDNQLKQALADRPQLLLNILRKSDMPFASVDVLSRFFQLPEIDFCMRVLGFFSTSAAGWRRLVEAKGEEAVFSYVEEQARLPHVSSNLPKLEQFCDVSAILGVLCDSVTDEQLASVRMDMLHEDLMALLEANSRLRNHDLDDLWSSGDDACNV